MTMINPSQNLSKQNHQSSVYGYYESFSRMSQLAEEGYEYYSQRAGDCLLGSDLALIEPMAEDESRTGSINETGSTSKDNNDINNIQEKAKDKEEDEGWLQLSIGTATNNEKNKPERGPVELDLLQLSSSELQGKSIFQHHNIPEFRAPPPPKQQLVMTTSTSSLFLQNPTSSTMFPQEINWGFRPMQIQQNIDPNFMPLLSAAGSYFSPRPFPVLHAGIGVPGPSTNIDFRVIDPPKRPHSGLWFSLQASLNQAKEPLLPQISKSYLRIKDGRMTIRLVLKYLVNKLQLENESEIEITCRGQQLQPFLTLQHVRDHIWSTTNAADNTTPSNHVMVLHYGRTIAA